MGYNKELNKILDKYNYRYKGVNSSTQIHAEIMNIFTEKCTGKNVAIWGVGKKNTVNSHAAIIIRTYALNLNGLSCLVDSSSDIQGTEFMGYPVISPEELEDSGVEVIIIGSRASAKAIAKNIEEVYPKCEYIDIYDELAKRGIKIDYNFFNEHNVYTELYSLRSKYLVESGKNKAYVLKELIEAYLSIRDFYYAKKYAKLYIDNKYSGFEDLIKMFNEIEQLCCRIKEINSKKDGSVCIHLIDSLRAIDVYKSDRGEISARMFKRYMDNAIIFSKAYSVGPTTFESMMGMIKQKLSFEEDVYDNSNFMFEFSEFPLLNDMYDSGKKIVFYVAKDYYIMEENEKIERKEHLHMSEKLWNVACDIAESDKPIFGFIYYPWELHYPLLCGYLRSEPEIHNFSDVGIDEISDSIEDQFDDCKKYVNIQFDYYKDFLGDNTVNVFLGDHSQPVYNKEHMNYPFFMYYNDPDRATHIAFFVSGNNIPHGLYNDVVSMLDFNVIMRQILCENYLKVPERRIAQYQYYNIQNKKMREVSQKYNFWDYTEGIQCFISKELLYVITATNKEEVYKLIDDKWVEIDSDEQKEFIEFIKENYNIEFPKFWNIRVGKI